MQEAREQEDFEDGLDRPLDKLSDERAELKDQVPKNIDNSEHVIISSDIQAKSKAHTAMRNTTGAGG